ncbi:UDP-N-acetylglucosamine 2-epimerase [Pajaroellobacter abortibovis]|uniref:UDP-N-acetylglucosamine 2-epimerase domain-containing protein n=1 Tax=Pajaroellobacter abortibovis TaxID=1882918 RepID=A0A1L6MZB7_9BACT|nr:UDP-N-acetylglucosamine 2-epimerase [Pajaroellobacter abortibovis]APS00788.1 hypothetical protein BCY86_08930 [Pajaroellobacter abortibovis]
MRLWFCLGTTAELIKIYPILVVAQERKIDWEVLSTGQSAVNLREQWVDFQLDSQHLHSFAPSTIDLHTSKQAAAWFSRAALQAATPLERKIETLTGVPIDRKQDRWIVQGDTLSTLLGAIYGKRLGLCTVHVEAGLRSGNLFNPFPEELNRRIVSKLATLHFPPDFASEQALIREKVKGPIIRTEVNTQVDATRWVLERFDTPPIPEGNYGLANIHRFENLQSAKRWKIVKDTLRKASHAYRLYIILHPITQEKLKHEAAFKQELEATGAVWLPRQPFVRFARWLKHAKFIICDSGGNQQECSDLGIPCLILREVTETAIPSDRHCTVLSRFHIATIDRFLSDPDAFRQERYPLESSPATTIVDALQESLPALRSSC